MELEFDITQSFNQDIKRLSSAQRKNIEKQINFVSQSLLNGQTAFKENSSIPYIFNLKGGLDSSLFLIKADQDHRIVAAVDEDPIYDKISLTLFRLVDKNKAESVYKEVGEELYKKSGIL
jgi:mRNA-degrading endonuclease RelE of RelBE toxin-antitoxin system